MKPETRNQKPSKRREQFKLYAPLLIWIGVIFFLSSSQGSMSQTSRIIRPILQFLFPSAPEETLLLYHGIVRKLAHFGEYAMLGLLACRAFAGSHQDSIRRFFYLAAMVLVLAVAVTDELNQSFNPDRTGSPFDALIDLGGGVFSVLAFSIIASRNRGSGSVSASGSVL